MLDHQKCADFQRRSTGSEPRPTRILRIEREQLTLCCNISWDVWYLYATLSHTWGADPEQQLILTRSNLSNFQERIAISSLPIIYQEARGQSYCLGRYDSSDPQHHRNDLSCRHLGRVLSIRTPIVCCLLKGPNRIRSSRCTILVLVLHWHRLPQQGIR